MRTFAKILGVGVGLVLFLVMALAAYLYMSAIRPARPVGFQQIEANDPGHRPIPVSIWYPTNAKPGFVLLGSTGLRVASDAPVEGQNLPLVVISHGTGGGAMSHADTALALAESGFIVAVPTHPGDNFQDDSDVGKPDWMPNRARHINRVIDAALGSWKDRDHIDGRRAGLFGFSAGATSALIAMGGSPDLRRIASHCAERPEFVCQLLLPNAYRDAPSVTARANPRIAAAVIAAPGLGFTFEPDGLSGVRAAVQLWVGANDQTVPYATNAGVIRRLLPKGADFRLAQGAAHYSFLMPCGLLGPPQLCKDAQGFDRKHFHEEFNRQVVAHFRAHLASGPPTPRTDQ